MDAIIASLRRERAVRLLIPLFFVSGATGLIYQTLWARSLHLVFGISQFAIATVLAAFMAGLAVGGFAMARFADRVARPLGVYGALEIGIGAYALLFPKLLELCTPLYLGFHRSADPSVIEYGLFQFALIGALLLVPTSCMGATLPLLARFATTRSDAAGDRVGLLYGVNTLGAVGGIWAAGFWLLPDLGLSTTNWLAAGANFALGFGALAMSRAHERADTPPAMDEPEEGDAASPAAIAPVLAVAALAGFAALIYEVAWFRLMGLILGGSTYAFSVMLLAFLLGIGIGGWAGGRPADRLLAQRGAEGTLMGLATLQVGVAALSYGAMWLYQELPFAFVALFDAVEDALELLWPAKLSLATAVMAPPALLMGATFPFMVRAVIARGGLGRAVGQVYGANTLGGLFGACLAGFVFLPALHVTGTVLLAVSVNLFAAVVALAAARSRVLLPATAGLAAFGGLAWAWPPPWDPMIMTAGMYKYASELDDRSRAGIMDYAVVDYDLLFYAEGLSSVVTVAQSKRSGNIWLANNGKVDASTTVDMPTQVLVTHLPALMADEPETSVVIGLASGITLGALTLYPELESIDIVELEPEIHAASRFFDDHNHRPLEDPRVTLYGNDGRNQLLLAEPGAYDVIISEPSNPWISGVSNLFTREFWEMGRERLAPGGVWGQWIQLYGMGEGDLRALLRTFSEVFPHVLLFSTIEDADLVLVGSVEPIDFSAARLQAAIDAHPAVAAELAQVDIDDAYDLLVRFQMDRDGLLEFAGDEGLNTDDNMRVEYNAPRYLHAYTGQDNLLAILSDSRTPLEAVDGPDGLVALARTYAEGEQWAKALICLKDARELAPESREIAMLTAEYQAELHDLFDGE